MIGKNALKASFWRGLTYFFSTLGLFFAAIFLLIEFSPTAPLQVLEISPEGKVLFWGNLKTPPKILPQEYRAKDLSLDNWQKLISKDLNKNLKQKDHKKG